MIFVILSVSEISTLNLWILRFLAKAQYDKDFVILSLYKRRKIHTIAVIVSELCEQPNGLQGVAKNPKNLIYTLNLWIFR